MTFLGTRVRPITRGEDRPYQMGTSLFPQAYTRRTDKTIISVHHRYRRYPRQDNHSFIPTYIPSRIIMFLDPDTLISTCSAR